LCAISSFFLPFLRIAFVNIIILFTRDAPFDFFKTLSNIIQALEKADHSAEYPNAQDRTAKFNCLLKRILETRKQLNLESHGDICLIIPRPLTQVSYNLPHKKAEKTNQTSDAAPRGPSRAPDPNG